MASTSSTAWARPGSTKSPRLQRLFGPDGKCLNVAIDHGIFGERRFLSGIEDMTKVLEVLCAAGPDAIQLTPGAARSFPASALNAMPRSPIPALVLRCDAANVYGSRAPLRPFCELLPGDVVGEAVRLDCAACIVNLFRLPEEPWEAGNHKADEAAIANAVVNKGCISNVANMRDRCAAVGMPLIVEPIAFDWKDEAEDGTRGVGLA